ncbi:MAG: helix-turn-helix transcriptional regulator [Pseudomonadota bacterium]
MTQEQLNIISHRVERLAPQLEKQKFRESYLESNIVSFLSNQIRAMRGGKSQKEFGEFLGKPQNIVSRLENPDSPKSIQSLLDIAHAHKVALLVKFVDYPTYLRETSDISDLSLVPATYNQAKVNEMICNNVQSNSIKQNQVPASKAEFLGLGSFFCHASNQQGMSLQ